MEKNKIISFSQFNDRYLRCEEADGVGKAIALVCSRSETIFIFKKYKIELRSNRIFLYWIIVCSYIGFSMWVLHIHMQHEHHIQHFSLLGLSSLDGKFNKYIVWIIVALVTTSISAEYSVRWKAVTEVPASGVLHCNQ